MIFSCFLAMGSVCAPSFNKDGQLQSVIDDLDLGQDVYVLVCACL